jgi:segregation and condensation protein B
MAENEATRSAVEAVLFAAGRPITVDELTASLGLSKKDVKAAISSLREDYESFGSAIEFTENDGRYTMQLQGHHARSAVSFAPREISNPVLRTLAIIAYYQPLLQSDLAAMRGNKAYDHVAELVEMKLISKRRHHRTYFLSTTSRFNEYFDMPGATPEEVKERISSASRGGTLDGWVGDTIPNTNVINSVRRVLPKRVV